MKILLTGASGYVASSLIPLLARSHEVYGLANSKPEPETDCGKLLRGYFSADITDKNSLENIFSENKFDVVVHLAAIINTATCISPDDFDNLFKVNVGGTINLLRCAIKNNSSFIFASSMSVYGIPKRIPVRENDLLEPISPYGLSKLEAENAVKFFYKNANLGSNAKAIILRLPGVFGGKRKKGVVAEILRAALEKRPPHLNVQEDLVWDTIHVEEACSAIISAINSIGKSKNQYDVFNVGYGKKIDLLSFAKEVAHILDSKQKPTVNGQGKMVPFAMDVSKTKKMLGFCPVPLKTRIRKMSECEL